MAVELTKKLLQRVNRDGNASAPYETENKEDWRPEASYTGKDCDSYTSYKKRQLLRMNWEWNEVMCIATCDADGDDGGRVDHAVLLVWVEADKTCYVLDNRHYWVESIDFFRKTHKYDFVSIPQYIQDLMT